MMTTMPTMPTMPHLLRLPLYLFAAGGLYFGLTYLLRAWTQAGWGAAYHQQVAGVASPNDLAQPGLYWTMLASAGALFATLGVAQLLLTYYGLPSRQPWVWVVLLSIAVLSMGILALMNLHINGTKSPWMLNLGMLAIAMLGLWLTWRWHVRTPLSA